MSRTRLYKPRRPDKALDELDAVYRAARRPQPPHAPVDCPMCGEPMALGWCTECSTGATP